MLEIMFICCETKNKNKIINFHYVQYNSPLVQKIERSHRYNLVQSLSSAQHSLCRTVMNIDVLARNRAYEGTQLMCLCKQTSNAINCTMRLNELKNVFSTEHFRGKYTKHTNVQFDSWFQGRNGLKKRETIS